MHESTKGWFKMRGKAYIVFCEEDRFLQRLHIPWNFPDLCYVANIRNDADEAEPCAEPIAATGRNEGIL